MKKKKNKKKTNTHTISESNAFVITTQTNPRQASDALDILKF